MKQLARRIATVLICGGLCSCGDDSGKGGSHADASAETGDNDSDGGSKDPTGGSGATESDDETEGTDSEGTDSEGTDSEGTDSEGTDSEETIPEGGSLDGGGLADESSDGAGDESAQPTDEMDVGEDDTTRDEDRDPTKLPPPCVGDGEPNESIATSCLVPIGELVAGTLTTNQADRADCYSFVMDEGVTYSVMVEKTSGAGGNIGTGDDLFVSLTTPSGIEHLDFSIDGNRAYIFQLEPTLVSELGTLCLTAGSPTSQYDYQFRINNDWQNGLEQDDVTFEPNDTPAMAYLVTVGDVWASTLTTIRSEFVDCYRFEMKANVTYSVMVEKTSGAGGNIGTSDDLFVSLTTPSGIEHLDFSIESDRAYIVQLDPTLVSELATLCFTAGAHGGQYDYQFRINEDWQNDLEQDDVTFEPNDTPAMAYPVSVGDVWESTLTTIRSEFVDCYRFEMEASITYSVMVEKTSGAGGNLGTSDDLFVSLTTPSGIEHLDFSIESDRAYIFQLDPTLVSELATLCVTAGAHGSSYQYRFRIDVDRQHGLDQNPTTFEPNDTPAMAYPVSLDAVVASSLTTAPSDYVDCFEFEVVAGAGYQVAVEKTGGAGGNLGTSDDLFVRLTSPTGGTPFSTNFDRNEAQHHEFTAVANEPATLCFTAGSHTSQYSYSFSVSTL